MDDHEKGKPETNDGLSRREWLLRVGETAALAGLAGAVNREAAAKGNDPGTSVQQAHLPPGLYEPSPDHLTHALTRNENFVRIPAGSPTDYVEPGNGPFHPQFFTSEEYEVVERLVDLMLDAPAGAGEPGSELKASGKQTEITEWMDLTAHSAAGVRNAAKGLSEQHRTLAIHFYGKDAVEEVESDSLQRTWREGLAWLDEKSREQHGKAFLELAAERQIAILNSISEPGMNKEKAGVRLFALVKRQTGHGYYTSSQGLEELGYRGNSFYAASPGCPKSGQP
jgi:hypothetical protein